VSSAHRRRNAAGQGTAKRIFDVTVSVALMVLLSPLLLVIAIAVRLRLGSPVIFRQERPGLHGRP
jgi:sugar transferase EpsL